MKLQNKHLWGLVIATLLIRLLSLGAYPLMDTTEARYGEMARLMVETQNWITPQFDYGVPFWGKPPLFTWMSAVSIELFGVNEFAVRLPHWLAGVLCLIVVALMAKKAGFSGLLTAAVVVTAAVFAVSAGAVMTDMALTLGLTMALVGFYRCWNGERIWGYVGFVGLAIGLLAKGPLTIVLFGLVVAPWVVITEGFKGIVGLVKRTPLLTGTLLMLVIALPWYIIAEKATPGFIDYFIVGEHFERFVVSGWEGDLYGSAHDETRGTIWLFWLYSALPWSLVLPAVLWKARAQWWGRTAPHFQIISYALLWMCAPMILFTFSGNILPAYVLPGIPAIGIIMAVLVPSLNWQWIPKVGAIMPVLLLIVCVILGVKVGEERSDKELLSRSNLELPTYYFGKRPFSGQFYSSGQAIKIEKGDPLLELDELQLVTRPKDLNSWPQIGDYSCTEVYHSTSKRALYHCIRQE